MTTAERMAKITKASAASYAAHNASQQSMKEYVKRLAGSIMAKYGQQVKEMVELSNVLVKSGYLIQTSNEHARITESQAPRFQTDGIYHNIGLYADKYMVTDFEIRHNVTFYAVGYAGGGCARPTLLVTQDGIEFNNTDISKYGCANPANPARDMWDGCISRLEEFDAEFPGLYNRFMDYVDNIENYPIFI